MAAARVPAIQSAERAYQLLIHLPHTLHIHLDPLNRTSNDRNMELTVVLPFSARRRTEEEDDRDLGLRWWI